jgi:hypothetical protein
MAEAEGIVTDRVNGLTRKWREKSTPASAGVLFDRCFKGNPAISDQNSVEIVRK